VFQAQRLELDKTAGEDAILRSNSTAALLHEVRPRFNEYALLFPCLYQGLLQSVSHEDESMARLPRNKERYSTPIKQGSLVEMAQSWIKKGGRGKKALKNAQMRNMRKLWLVYPDKDDSTCICTFDESPPKKTHSTHKSVLDEFKAFTQLFWYTQRSRSERAFVLGHTATAVACCEVNFCTFNRVPIICKIRTLLIH
jgi:hypothetical protein